MLNRSNDNKICRRLIHPGHVSCLPSTCLTVGRSDGRFFRLTTPLRALLRGFVDVRLSLAWLVEVSSWVMWTGSTCILAAGTSIVYNGKRVPKEKMAATTQNEYCAPRLEVTALMMPGMTAPPDIAAVRKTDPILVYPPRPRSDMAKMIEKMPDCRTAR